MELPEGFRRIARDDSVQFTDGNLILYLSERPRMDRRTTRDMSRVPPWRYPTELRLACAESALTVSR